MNSYTEINRSKNYNRFLAIAHFIIAVFYILQEIINIRNSIFVNDEIIDTSVIDMATYISIGISLIPILANIIAGIGSLKWKSWSWSLSVAFFLYLLIQKVVAFIFGVYTKFFVLGIGEDFLQMSNFDFILNCFYVSVIAIIALLYLNNNQVYNGFKKNISSKKGNFFICLGIAFAFIFINIILGQII